MSSFDLVLSSGYLAFARQAGFLAAVEAVAASCAIPWMFAPVEIGGRSYADGGMVDRTALRAWTKLRGDRPAVVHLVERSRSGAEADTGPHPVVRSGRARASLLGFTAFEQELAETRERALAVLAPLAAAG